MEMIVDTAVKYNHIFLAGVKVTIVISFAACLFGLLLGIILAFMKLSKIKPLVWAANVYVEVIRGTTCAGSDFSGFFGLPYHRDSLPQL